LTYQGPFSKNKPNIDEQPGPPESQTVNYFVAVASSYGSSAFGVIYGKRT